MVIYGPEHLLWREQQGCHFPYGHLKVHLRELEQPVAEDFMSATGLPTEY